MAITPLLRNPMKLFRKAFNRVVHLSNNGNDQLVSFHCPFRKKGLCFKRQCPFSHDPRTRTEIPVYVCLAHLLGVCPHKESGPCGFHLAAAELLDLANYEQQNEAKLEVFFGAEEWHFECAICLDRVHSKPAEERKFAYHENCIHILCSSCATGWRVEARISCPVCRTDSWRIKHNPRLLVGEQKRALFPPGEVHQFIRNMGGQHMQMMGTIDYH